MEAGIAGIISIGNLSVGLTLWIDNFWMKIKSSGPIRTGPGLLSTHGKTTKALLNQYKENPSRVCNNSLLEKDAPELFMLSLQELQYI